MPIIKDKIKREMTVNMKTNTIDKKKQNRKSKYVHNETKQQLVNSQQSIL